MAWAISAVSYAEGVNLLSLGEYNMLGLQPLSPRRLTY